MSVIACETCVKADVCKYRQEFEDYCLEIEALVNKKGDVLSPFTFEAKCNMCLSMAIKTTVPPNTITNPWNTFYRDDITMCNNGGH
jgi:hypothetical protein